MQLHDILLLRTSAILPEAITAGGLTPTTDTSLLLTTYRGGVISQLLSLLFRCVSHLQNMFPDLFIDPLLFKLNTLENPVFDLYGSGTSVAF